MGDIKYCPNCRRNVDISIWDTTSIIILIILLIIGLLPGLIYLVYKLAKSKKCPNCGTLESDLEPPDFGSNFRASVSPRSGGVFCSKCGAKLRE